MYSSKNKEAQYKWRKIHPEAWRANQERYRRKHKEERKKKNIEALRKGRERNHAFLKKYKLERGCQVCGYKKCAKALEFHHIDSNNKEYHVSYTASRAYSLKLIQKELEKCIILCANCHRELHVEEENKNGTIEKV